MTSAPLAEAHRPETTDLLTVEGLEVAFATASGWLRVVEDVGFTVAPGETLGLVGESGCGKTVSSLAGIGLISRRSGRVRTRSLRFAGRVSQPNSAWMATTGMKPSIVAQKPKTDTTSMSRAVSCTAALLCMDIVSPIPFMVCGVSIRLII